MDAKVKLHIEYDIEKRNPSDNYRFEPIEAGDITEEMIEDIAFEVERLINEGRLTFGRGERFNLSTNSHYAYEVTVYLRCKVVLNEE